MQLTKIYWEQYLSEIGLPELPLSDVTLQKFDIKYIQDLYFNMDSVFSQFLKFCAVKRTDQLIKSGFKSADLDLMEKGVCPHNASIMLKIPLEYGGDISPDNLYVVPKNPFQFIISHFISYQIDKFNEDIKSNRDLKILPEILFTPYPPGISFIPAIGAIKGGGGTSQGGKSTQLASQIEQNRIKSNNDMIIQRNLMRLAKKQSKGK